MSALPDDVMEKMVEAALVAHYGTRDWPRSYSAQETVNMRAALTAALAHCPAQGGVMAGKDKDAIYAAYLGICILRTMCRKVNLKLAEQRAHDLLGELGTAFPFIGERVGLSALRETAAPSPPIRDAEIERLTAEVARLRAALPTGE